MATSTEPQVLVTRNDTDQRFVLDKVGWQGDEAMRPLVSLRVFRLKPEGAYESCATSPALPFLPLDEVTRLLKSGVTMNHTRWGRMIRASVRDELAPRDRRAGEGAAQL